MNIPHKGTNLFRVIHDSKNLSYQGFKEINQKLIDLYTNAIKIKGLILRIPWRNPCQNIGSFISFLNCSKITFIF